MYDVMSLYQDDVTSDMVHCLQLNVIICNKSYTISILTRIWPLTQPGKLTNDKIDNKIFSIRSKFHKIIFLLYTVTLESRRPFQ